jgi:two-component system, sensor histidine kinase
MNAEPRLWPDDEPASTLEAASRQIAKLRKINHVLMQRVERSMEQQANAYSLFQTAIGLETQVRVRTDELKSALNRLERINDELVVARDSSEQANRFKTRFFTAVGHDLLQPLHAARLSLSSLTEGASDASEVAVAKQIDHSLSSIEELLRTILDISRLDAGVIEPDLRPVSLNDLFGSLVSSLGPLASAKNLTLTARPTDAAVVSDPVMLRRILQNLLANAVHYTQTGGVKLAARRRADGVRIEVWDTGPGIGKDEQVWIFEEFQRGSASETSRRGGFGLGLSIAQKMAETLGHPLGVCSRLKRGSMFKVTAPYAGSSRNMAPAALTVTATAAYGFSGAEILLIDNDAAVQEAMRTLLERWSCKLRFVSGLHELGALISDPRYRPSIILADYHLDFGECGLAGVRRMRAVCGAGLPAVVITADHSEAIAEEVRQADCQLLRKPVRPAELRALIQHLLKR